MSVFSLILQLLIFFHPVVWAAQELHGFEGEQINIVGKGRAWVENGEIVHADLIANGLKLNLLKNGRTALHLGTEAYTIFVLSRTQSRSFEILNQAIRKTLGLRLQIEKDRITVRGRLVRWQDWENLALSCNEAECNYDMLAEIPKSLESTIKDRLADKFQEASIYQYRIEYGDHLQLHLSPKNPQKEKILGFISRYGIRGVLDLTSIDMVPLVKVQVTIAEVKKSEFLKYGIEWPGSYEARVLGPGAGTGGTLDLSLQGLEQNGLGKVLASPNLLCKSGKEAEFWAGGEFPIKVIAAKTHGVLWKKYGILMKVKPVADHTGRMSISIETEISSIDPDRTVDGVPALYTNRLESHFDLSKSKTIALSGLIKREQGESQNGIPGLSRIPILGALFSSNDFRENRTELVIFVKPEIISERDEP